MSKPEGFDPHAFVEKSNLHDAWGEAEEGSEDPDLEALKELGLEGEDDDYKLAA